MYPLHLEEPSLGSKERMFACDYPGCNQKFRTKFSCKRHRLTHTKEKQFTCEHCGKKFTLAQHLKEHSYRHTKQKPYICGVLGCQQAFRHASELSLHRRTHPEYNLRKYHYPNEKETPVSDQGPPSKIVAVSSEPQEEMRETLEKPKVEHVPTSDINSESLIRLSGKGGGVRSPTLDKSLDNTYGLDMQFLEYLTTITNSEAPVTRPVLPLPGLYCLISCRRPHCTCQCECHNSPYTH